MTTQVPTSNLQVAISNFAHAYKMVVCVLRLDIHHGMHPNHLVDFHFEVYEIAISHNCPIEMRPATVTLMHMAMISIRTRPAMLVELAMTIFPIGAMPQFLLGLQGLSKSVFTSLRTFQVQDSLFSTFTFNIVVVSSSFGPAW